MATLTVSGTLSFPIADEGTPPSRPYSFTLNYTEKNTDDLVFSGAVADEDIMGKIADAKAVFIECLTGGGEVKLNGAANGVDLAPGSGYASWYNTAGGLTSMTVTTTGAASFRMYMFS